MHKPNLINWMWLNENRSNFWIKSSQSPKSAGEELYLRCNRLVDSSVIQQCGQSPQNNNRTNHISYISDAVGEKMLLDANKLSGNALAVSLSPLHSTDQMSHRLLFIIMSFYMTVSNSPLHLFVVNNLYDYWHNWNLWPLNLIYL